MLRQEVLSLYRSMLRSIKQIPDKDYRSELLEWARRDFRNNAHQTDELAIKMQISYGKRTLRELQTTINLAK